jgi:hypothetical protein
LKAPGNLGALLLSRTRGDDTEFLVLSFWKSASSSRRPDKPDVDGAVAWELFNPSPIGKNYEVVMYHLPDEG